MQHSIFIPEEWRDIPGCEGHYQISNHGQVRSIDRMITTKTGKERLMRGRILKPGFHPQGYPQVRLRKNGKLRTVRIHNLVAEAFIGPCPEGQQVRHQDDVPTNNFVWNLSYGTPSQNRNDSVRNGTHYEARRTHCERGHEFTPENTRPQHTGRGRVCLTCKRERNRRHYLERKARLAAKKEARETTTPEEDAA